MSKELTEFLTKLSVDEKLAEEFEKDKVATMTLAGVSKDHQKLVIEKDYAKIQTLLGANYKISSNEIIKAFKK